MADFSVPLLFIRLGVGISFFGHGLVRLPKLHAFSDWMTAQFAASALPRFAVLPFSYALPVAEFTAGLLLVAGLFQRTAAVAASVVMFCLLFGTCLIEEWSSIPSQLIHVFFLAVLLTQTQANTYSIDHLLKKQTI